MGQRIKSYYEAQLEEREILQKIRSGELKPLRTSLSKFNNATFDGMIEGHIWGIVGMSGAGKTRIMSQIIDDFVNLEINQSEKVEVLNFNYEMQARRLVLLDIARTLGKTTRQIYGLGDVERLSDEEFDNLINRMSVDHNIKIYFVDDPANSMVMRETIDEFMSTRRETRTVITLDHTALLPFGGLSEKDGIQDIMKMFNQSKKVYPKSSYIVLSQMNRDIESKERILDPQLHYPKKGDIYGSDALYQFSDMIVVIHKPEDLMIENYGPNGVNTEGKVFLHFIKARDGDREIAILENSLSTGKLVEIS